MIIELYIFLSITALVGMTIGVMCAGVDTCTSWLLSIREGVCWDAPQLHQRLCCPGKDIFEGSGPDRCGFILF